MDADDAAIFAEYHRRERRRATWLAAAIVYPAAFGTLAVGLLFSFTQPTADDGVPHLPSAPTIAPAPTSTPAPTALPEPPPSDLESAPPPVVQVVGSWTIDIGATGYQTELDRCLWVRMDLGVAPIVGAHTSCGGSIVLEMDALDDVTLAGEGLDGRYVVEGSRDARAGDPAATATEGLVADVILQTCYPGGDGRVRLVALARVGDLDPAASATTATAA